MEPRLRGTVGDANVEGGGGDGGDQGVSQDS